ncbi:hypothetical protein [Xaviernesmea oryzae]|uniref:hypothetical protein n=1 Tax=Xaviernesmea oryzae TaxID=464029 RepID=UPI0008C91C27|nr:hypothetical protein [Xaviernesmea oryzae]SEL33064.1 hypothetical protein SAMN04487976_107145 [Xaviernesmea oryzae]
MFVMPSLETTMRAFLLAVLIAGPLGALAAAGSDTNKLGNGAGLVLFVTLQRQAMS